MRFVEFEIAIKEEVNMINRKGLGLKINDDDEGSEGKGVMSLVGRQL